MLIMLVLEVSCCKNVWSYPFVKLYRGPVVKMYICIALLTTILDNIMDPRSK